MRLFLAGGSSSGVTSVTGTAPVTSSGGATPAIGLTPNTFWQTPVGSGPLTNLGIGVNQTLVVAHPLEWPISIGHLTFNVTTADNSGNLYDFGLYNSAGTLVANIGPASYTTTGVKTGALAQGTVRLNPGLYYFACTGNANVLAISGTSANGSRWQFGANTNVAASSGGTLPASITPPSTTPIDSAITPWYAFTP